MGDGDRITLSKELVGWKLEFSKGWGDCPAGCINRDRFFFRFDPLVGTVSKTGENLSKNRPHTR